MLFPVESIKKSPGEYMPTKILMWSLLIVCMACSRAQNETAKIVFELPPAEVQQKSTFSLLSLDEWADDLEVEDNWISMVPTGFDGQGTSPVNCYALMVGGPDANYKVNYCGSEVANSDEITRIFEFGPWLGGIPATAAGARLELDLQAGKDRVFYLVGFHAPDIAACVDFRKFSPNQSDLTRPLIIGQVGGVSLEPGATQEIRIVRTIDANKGFDDCKFNDGSSKDDEGEQLASKVLLEKAVPAVVGGSVPESPVALTYSSGTTLGTAYCTPLKIRLADSKLRPAQHNQPLTTRLRSCLTASADAADCYALATNQLSATIPSFSDYFDCADSTIDDGDLQFQIAPGNRFVHRWIRNPVNGSRNLFIRAEVERNDFTPIVPNKFETKLTSDVAITTVDMPKNFVTGLCYNLIARRHTLAGSSASTSDWDYVKLEKLMGNNSWLDVTDSTIFKTAGCTGAADTNIFSGGSLVNFNIKLPDAPGNFRLTMADTTGAIPAVNYLKSVAGSSQVKMLQVTGKAAASEAGCAGPFKLRALNENGSRVKTTAATTLNISTTGGLEVYPVVGCSSGAIATIEIPFNYYEKEFFVKLAGPIRNSVVFRNSTLDLETRIDIDAYEEP